MNLLISVFHFSSIIWYFYAGKIHLRCFPFQCLHFLNRSQDARWSACREVSLVTSVPHSQEDRFASLLMEDTLWAETLMNCQRHYIAWHGHADLGHMDLVKIVVWWKSQSLCCPFWILHIMSQQQQFVHWNVMYCQRLSYNVLDWWRLRSPYFVMWCVDFFIIFILFQLVWSQWNRYDGMM